MQVYTRGLAYTGVLEGMRHLFHDFFLEKSADVYIILKQ